MNLNTQAAPKLGTFGFVQFTDEEVPRAAVILHIFKKSGHLGIHYEGNKHFRAIVPASHFTPSRDAFFGSSYEPEWVGDSAVEGGWGGGGSTDEAFLAEFRGAEGFDELCLELGVVPLTLEGLNALVKQQLLGDAGL